jgi:hypothetical protein
MDLVGWRIALPLVEENGTGGGGASDEADEEDLECVFLLFFFGVDSRALDGVEWN